MEHDFDVDLQVNRFKLDEECERHAAVYHYWAEERAKARADLAAAEDALDMKGAEVQLAIGSDRDERTALYPNITVAVAKALVETHPDVVAAKDELRTAKSRVNHLDACVYSLESRKSMLGNLVELWVKAYYSEVRKSAPSAADDLQSDTRASLNARDKQRQARKEEDKDEEE